MIFQIGQDCCLLMEADQDYTYQNIMLKNSDIECRWEHNGQSSYGQDRER